MRIVLAVVLVVAACMAALLFMNQGGDTVPVPPASAPPAAAAQPLPPAAAPPVAAAAAPKPAPAAEGKPGLQAQFDQALAARDTRIESFLIDGKGIDSNHIAALSDENNYRRFAERMRADASQQSLNDTVAFQQLLLSRGAVTSGAVAVSDVVCGASLCTASASGDDPAQLAGYYNGMSKGHDLPKPMYSPLYVPYRTPSGFGMRLVFSIDAAVNEGGIP